MSAILEVDNLAKKYGDFEAIKGVSFSDVAYAER